MKKISLTNSPLISTLGFVSVLWLGMVSTSFGYTSNNDTKAVLSDGSFDDTAAAVAYVSQRNEDGWIVTIGSAGGAYTWPQMLNVSVQHAFTLQGASPSVRPTITSTATSGFGVYVNCSDGKTVTIKDIRFQGWNSSNALFLIEGGGEDCFRLTNLEFSGGSANCIWVSSLGTTDTRPGPYGLIDHCSVPNGGGFIFIRDNPSARPNSWHRPMSWGTKRAVYIEDCNLSAPRPIMGVWGVTDGDNGARFVVRHCTLNNMPFGTHGADSQPLENGQNPNHSNLQAEIMHNTFSVTGALDTFFILRGGSATIFDNTLTGSGDGFMNTMTKTSFYRATEGNGVCPVDRTYPADYLGTQQPGCGVVDAPGQDPKNPTEPWGSVPIYSWGNKLNVPIVWGEVGSSQWVSQNRDFFIGKARPGYTEFTYPHPLQGVGNNQAGRPLPPANLRIAP